MDGTGSELGILVAALVAVGGLVAVVRARRRPAELDAEEPVRALPAPVVAAPTLVDRFRAGLARSRDALLGRLGAGLGGRAADADLDALEEALLLADVGVPTTQRLIDAVRAARTGDVTVREALAREARGILERVGAPLRLVAPADGPLVLLVVGVNGSGKTTTIGKLAARLVREGRSVLLAAADTYRAAAAEQLAVWADRAGAQLVRHAEGADPGAVVFDALEAARARGIDVVIIDTAGRLQTAKPLMEQLGKVRRVVEKKLPGAPHETLLVLDGTMGQNALAQARAFHEAAPVTGAVVTKLDGTAKGGMVLAVAAELGLAVKLVGIGEKVDDLRDFDAASFVDGLLGGEGA